MSINKLIWNTAMLSHVSVTAFIIHYNEDLCSMYLNSHQPKIIPVWSHREQVCLPLWNWQYSALSGHLDWFPSCSLHRIINWM